MRELIGAGSSAEVLALDSHRVLKLFYPEVALSAVEREFEASRIAYAAGLRAPRPMYQVTEGERQGIVFERILGKSLIRHILREPYRMWTYFPQAAAYQRDIHRHLAPDALPTIHERAERTILLSSFDRKTRETALALLGQLPAGDRLAHGDFHPGNLLLSGKKIVAVDWSRAWMGPPAADVARTELLIHFGSDKTGVGSRVPRSARQISAWWYRQCYQHHHRIDRNQIDHWRFVLAVAWFHGQSNLARAGLPRAVTKWMRNL